MAEKVATRRGDDPYTFGIGDLFSKVAAEGLPANVRALLETAVRHNLDLPNAKFGNEVFTEKQLERLREIIKNRKSDLVNFPYPLYGTDRQVRKAYKGPFDKTLGIGSLLADVFNDEAVLVTSLGGFQVREDDKNYYIFDPFDFTGVPGSLSRVIAGANRMGGSFAYEVLRGLATNISHESSDPDAKPPPVFELTIPKEGPIPRGPPLSREEILKGTTWEARPSTEDMVAARKKSAGGFIDKPLYEDARVGGLI